MRLGILAPERTEGSTVIMWLVEIETDDIEVGQEIFDTKEQLEGKPSVCVGPFSKMLEFLRKADWKPSYISESPPPGVQTDTAVKSYRSYPVQARNYP